VRKRLGLLPAYEKLPLLHSVKVAVLDYGFDGVEGTRPYLPQGTVVVEHYDPEFIRRFGLGDPAYKKSFAPQNRHGRTMAQIVWAVTGLDPGGPKFYLLNANGPTMLRRAVRYAIEAKVDIILFSGGFEGGGNGDGRGPINRIVADALAADIIWINAAGNYGRHVYNGPVRLHADGYLRLRGGDDPTTLRFRNLLDENTVTVTLTWNDYQDKEDAGTDKDLDLYVDDPNGRRIGAGEKTQVSGDRVSGPEESRNPRERVVLADLPADPDRDYHIRIRAKKNNFTAEDRIRVLITSSRESYVDPNTGEAADAVKFLDASGKGELYPPADNPLVLTVGDASPSSAVGPTADHRVKPDVILEESRAFFTDGEVSAGASNSAAYFTGVVALLKAAEPGLRSRHLLWLARQNAAPTNGSREMTAVPSRGLSRPATDGMPRQAQFAADGRTIASAAPRREVLIDPSRQRVMLQGKRHAYSLDLGNRTLVISNKPAAPRTAELLPAPRETQAVADQSSSAQNRVWRTPSRAHLAEVVRPAGSR
jgi:hypothetical protein